MQEEQTIIDKFGATLLTDGVLYFSTETFEKSSQQIHADISKILRGSGRNWSCCFDDKGYYYFETDLYPFLNTDKLWAMLSN